MNGGQPDIVAGMRNSTSEHIRKQRTLAPTGKPEERRANVRHWSETPAFNDREVRLVPLHPDHTSQWLAQSSDEHLRTMTQIPCFGTEAKAREWITQCWAHTREAASLGIVQTYSFAIVVEHTESDNEAPLAGCLTLFRSGVLAYLSFWVGVEYQGRGIGTRAVQVVNRVALSVLGIHRLYTAAFARNEVSQHVLSRAGWATLPFRALRPWGALVFLHRPLTCAPAPRAKLRRQLCTLLRDIGSDFLISPDELL